MFLGLVLLPLVAGVAAGGWGAVTDGLRDQDPQLLSVWGPDGWTALSIFQVLSLALIGLGFLGSPQIFVRFLALRSETEIGRGTTVALVWTLLADTGAVCIGMIGRHLLMTPGQALSEQLGAGGQNVLPILVAHVLPALFVGLYIAIVLAAIMSTVDSLLVVAASAAVRDWWQKVRHPDLPDTSLVGLSRAMTVVLALVALAVALTIAATVPGRTIFWFVIFGWSGIAATFCPTMILSLYWPRMTARGALAGMVTGFVCVPLFKFAAPQLPGVGNALAALGELPPSFLLGGLAAVVCSITDRQGQEQVLGAHKDLQDL
jgi:Na+/proline symporter